MIENKTRELDRLAQGASVDPDEFLALLSDANARHELDQVAALRCLFGGGEPDLATDAVMDVTWEELAQHAEGALTDEERRLAAERFLNQYFPEALGDVAGNETALGTRDTMAGSPPEERRE